MWDLAMQVGREWLSALRVDTIRYVMFSIPVWFVLWVVLAPLLKGRKIRPDSPKPAQLVSEFAHSLRSIAVFSTVSLATFAAATAGWFDGPKIAATWGPAWYWVCLVLMIVAHDAYFYWTHRLIHHPKLFRAFHRRHHKSHNPSPFTAYSFDIGEAAIQAAFVPLWVLIVPTPWGVAGLFMLHQLARNTIGHSGYELFPATRNGKPLFDWLTTVTHHDLHHEKGFNYGLYFTFWDRLMGTEHPDYHARFAAAVRAKKVVAVAAMA
jgi:sterol desaturase/sphingolipid hydroxylase (fatty acid hydroxylase superfamily)